MRFVTISAGRVGLRTARVLREEGRDTILVESDRDRVGRTHEANSEAFEGDGSREEVFVDAGIEAADALGVLTADLNVNFTACIVGKHSGCRTVPRVDEDYREVVYQRYAKETDEIIYPERLGAIGAKSALPGGFVRVTTDIAQYLQVIFATVIEESPMNGCSIEEVALPANACTLAFGKKDGPIGIPLLDDSLGTGDRVAVPTDFDVLNDVRQLLVGDEVVTVVEGT